MSLSLTILILSLGVRMFFIMGLFVLSVAALLAVLLFPNANAAIDRIIQQQTADIPNGRYLFLRYSGDEAAAALSAAQFVAWLGTKVSAMFTGRSPAKADEVLTHGWRGVLVAYAAIVGILLLVAMLVGLPHQTFSFSIVQIMGSSCVAILGLLAVLFVQATTIWAFGWTDFVSGFLVELAIEPLPFGEHSLTLIDWAASGDLQGIVHSWTWAHQAAIQEIKDWVGAILRG